MTGCALSPGPLDAVTAARTAAAPASRQLSARLTRCGGWTALELLLAALIVGVLAGVALPSYNGYVEKARSRQAGADIAVIQAAISNYVMDLGGQLPPTLASVSAGIAGMTDPWGRAYQYVNHATSPKGHWRKDKNIVPINSDYDLFSLGADGGSSPPLTAASSRDDIVRANDGRFVGLASEYDP